MADGLEIQVVEPEERIPVEEEIDAGPVVEPLIYDEDAPNLIEAFDANPDGKVWLEELASRVKEDWDREWEASARHRETFAADWKIFSGDLDPLKNPPYEFCANAHVPIMLENLSRIVFRMTGELFGDWNNVFGVVPLGPDDEKVAEIMTIHGNWQLRAQIPDFKRQIAHRAPLAFLAVGDVTVRSYYDTRTRLNCHEVLTPEDFVTPFSYVTTKPDYSDLPWYAFKFLRYRHELEAEAELGNWHGIADLLVSRQPRLSDEPDAPLTQAVSEVTGREEAEDELGNSAPYKLIWWEGWQSIPPSETSLEPLLPLPTDDIDKAKPKQRFLRVIMDYVSKRLLLVNIHEMANWQEKERFNRQKQELEAFRQAKTEHDMIVQQHANEVRAQQTAIDMNAGMMGVQQEMMAREALAALSSAPLPPPPQAPPWLDNPDDPLAQPEKPRKEPIRLFTHIVCIEPLVGNLGLGYGRIESAFNKAANTVLSQFIDSATLANIKTILTSGIEPAQGAIKFTPGQINFVKGLPQDVKNSIMELSFDQANPQMIELLNIFIQLGQSAMQAPTVMSGEAGKSGETYRGLAARIEQAMKQLSVLTGKFRDGLEQVLKNNALLNSFFLRDEEIYMVANHILGMAQEIRVGRSMYERNYLVEIRADLRFTTMAQKVAEADEIVQMSLRVPILLQNPDFQHVAVKKALEARGRHDMAMLMGALPSERYKQALQQWEQAAAQAQATGQPIPPKPLPPGTPQPQQQGGPQQKPQGENAAKEIERQ